MTLSDAGVFDAFGVVGAVVAQALNKARVGSATANLVRVFMAFSKWIEYRSTIDPEVTPELVRAINKYQDLYITEQMGIK